MECCIGSLIDRRRRNRVIWRPLQIERESTVPYYSDSFLHSQALMTNFVTLPTWSACCGYQRFISFTFAGVALREGRSKRGWPLVEIVSSYDFPVSAQQTYNVYSGAIEDRLLEYAREHKTDLILLGHQRTHRRHRALARRLAMHAPVPSGLCPKAALSNLAAFSCLSISRPASCFATRGFFKRSNGLDRISALHVRFNEQLASTSTKTSWRARSIVQWMSSFPIST